MDVIWHKIWFDLWHNKVRTGLAVLSITVGVFAIGTTFGLSDQLLSGMDNAHQASSPSHFSMYLDTTIDRNTATSLKDVEGVEDIEPSNRISVLYKVRPGDEWKQGVMIMQDDYERQTYDVSQLKEGQWPGKGDVGIERLSSEYFKLGIGDEVIFKLGKTQKALPITGKIRYPFLEPPMFGGAALFFANRQGLERFGIPDGEFSVLSVRAKPYSADYAKEVATRIKDRLAKEKVGVPMVRYQDPTKHWGRMYVEGITLVLKVLAVISLLASVVLVLNTLTALITQQTDQIGILRALGGRTNTLVKVYLAGVVIYGLSALFVSLPMGTLVAFGVSRMILGFFDIDYDVFQVSGQAIILQVLAATVVPLLAALWPVLRGAAMTVREAIATYGLGGDFGSSWLDRAVERIGGRLLPSHYATALGNLFRRKGRLILTQAVLMTAGTMFLAVMSLSASVTSTLDQEFARRHYDTTMTFEENQRSDRVVSMALSVDGVENAEVWPAQQARILRQGQPMKEAGVGLQITGVPAGSATYKPLIVAGRWLQPGDDGGSRVVVMDEKTAIDNHFQLGDTITLDLGALKEEEWQVVGFYRAVASGEYAADTLYAPLDAVCEATQKYNQGRKLYVSTRLHTQASANEVTARLRVLYEGRNMQVGESRSIYKARNSAVGEFSVSQMMLLFLAVLMAVVGGIGLMGALSISVVERTKEIGVLRAIGARSRTIRGMFVMEGALQGLFSWALAVPLSSIISRPFADALGQAMLRTTLDFRYDYTAVIIWLVVVSIISTLASILPARNATQISVRDSLAYA
jgi:putative ABC transport system permease protein